MPPSFCRAKRRAMTAKSGRTGPKAEFLPSVEMTIGSRIPRRARNDKLNSGKTNQSREKRSIRKRRPGDQGVISNPEWGEKSKPFSVVPSVFRDNALHLTECLQERVENKTSFVMTSSHEKFTGLVVPDSGICIIGFRYLSLDKITGTGILQQRTDIPEVKGMKKAFWILVAAAVFLLEGAALAGQGAERTTGGTFASRLNFSAPHREIGGQLGESVQLAKGEPKKHGKSWEEKEKWEKEKKEKRKEKKKEKEKENGKDQQEQGQGSQTQPAEPAQPGGSGQSAVPAEPAQPGGRGQSAVPAEPAQPGGSGQSAVPAEPAQPGGSVLPPAPPLQSGDQPEQPK